MGCTLSIASSRSLSWPLNSFLVSLKLAESQDSTEPNVETEVVEEVLHIAKKPCIAVFILATSADCFCDFSLFLSASWQDES